MSAFGFRPGRLGGGIVPSSRTFFGLPLFFLMGSSPLNRSGSMFIGRGRGRGGALGSSGVFLGLPRFFLIGIVGQSIQSNCSLVIPFMLKRVLGMFLLISSSSTSPSSLVDTSGSSLMVNMLSPSMGELNGSAVGQTSPGCPSHPCSCFSLCSIL